MATARLCTECDQPVTGERKTCSDRCRQRRTRRIASEARARGENVGRADAAALVEDADKQELIAEVFRNELTPHVRDAITDDVLKGIAAMASMSEELVQSLAADLRSPDAVSRGRAQSLMAKYLFGQIDPTSGKHASLTVNLGAMPTPAQNGDAVVEGTVEEQRECERCHVLTTDFQPGAPRCEKCQAELRAEIEARLA